LLRWPDSGTVGDPIFDEFMAETRGRIMEHAVHELSGTVKCFAV
jgi:hypothetical protein